MSVAPEEVAKSLEGFRENSQKNRELEETKRRLDEALIDTRLERWDVQAYLSLRADISYVTAPIQLSGN